MHRFAHAILILAVAWGSVVPAFGGVRGMMLCFSSGGHVAIESTHVDPSCVSLCEDDEPRTSGGLAEPSLPHDCSDVTLPSLDVRVDRVQPERPTVPDPAPVAVALDLPPDLAPRAADAGDRFSLGDAVARGSSFGLVTVRTVVLRI